MEISKIILLYDWVNANRVADFRFNGFSKFHIGKLLIVTKSFSRLGCYPPEKTSILNKFLKLRLLKRFGYSEINVNFSVGGINNSQPRGGSPGP